MNNQNLGKSFSIRNLTIAAVFTALITVLTMISFTVPGGGGAYIHLGDSLIYACAWALGGPAAGLASGLGSMLADILLGAPQYALITLIIKFIMGYVCYLIMKAFSYKIITNIFAMAVASIIMVAGYTIYEYFLNGVGSIPLSLLFNSIQAVGGVVLGAVVIYGLNKIKAFTPFITWKVNEKNE